jgi:hypothetical protein
VKIPKGQCAMPHFVGDLVYIATGPCMGSRGGGVAALYSWAGKKVADVQPRDLNIDSAMPVHAGGDHWAIAVIADFSDSKVFVFDGKTGKQVHQIEIKAPQDCDRCLTALGSLGGWEAQPMVKLPSGKLATITKAGVSIVDPTAGKVEVTHRLPLCPAKP